MCNSQRHPRWFNPNDHDKKFSNSFPCYCNGKAIPFLMREGKDCPAEVIEYREMFSWREAHLKKSSNDFFFFKT